MCSSDGEAGPEEVPESGLAARLARAIDDLAAADESDVAGLLARAWAMVAAADPELAARTARYTR